MPDRKDHGKESVEVRFLEKPADPESEDRCVDGRRNKRKQAKLGFQNLGGSLGSAVFKAIESKTELTPDYIDAIVKKLHKPGVHGHCGFANNLEKILQFAQAEENRDYILDSLKGVPANIKVKEACDLIKRYDKKIELPGDELVNTAGKSGADVAHLDGEHAERIAYVNFKEGTTFDTQTANEQGWQAFNLDLWAVKKQAELTGVNADLAQGMALILYLATERILRPGKEPLKVVFHK